MSPRVPVNNGNTNSIMWLPIIIQQVHHISSLHLTHCVPVSKHDKTLLMRPSMKKQMSHNHPVVGKKNIFNKNHLWSWDDSLISNLSMSSSIVQHYATRLLLHFICTVWQFNDKITFSWICMNYNEKLFNSHDVILGPNRNQTTCLFLLRWLHYHSHCITWNSEGEYVQIAGQTWYKLIVTQQNLLWKVLSMCACV